MFLCYEIFSDIPSGHKTLEIKGMFLKRYLDVLRRPQNVLKTKHIPGSSFIWILNILKTSLGRPKDTCQKMS